MDRTPGERGQPDRPEAAASGSGARHQLSRSAAQAPRDQEGSMSSARASLALSVLALFIALGGGAVALQGKNSVSSNDIKEGAVKSSDVQDEGLKRADIKPDAIASPQLDDGSVVAADVGEDALTGDAIDESTLAGLGATSFDALPHALLTATSGQTFANNFHDTVEMDTVVSLEDLTFNDATDRLTVNTPGLYLASGWIAWDANAAGHRRLDFRKNFTSGALFFGGVTMQPAAPGADQASTTWVERFDDGETLELAALQDTGANLDTVTVLGRHASLSLTWLGP
jgi:hypothetical protein